MSTKEHLLDSLLTIFIFSPLVICYWAGTWGLMDIYFFPDSEVPRGCVCVGISYIIMFTAFAIDDVLTKYVKPDNVVLYILVTRVYTYLSALGLVANWRGLWVLLDHYLGVTLHGASVTFVAGVLLLLVLRAFRNVLSPPLPLALDVDTNQHFAMFTRFRSKKGGVWYVLDVLFSVCVVSTLVVLAWRGTWQLYQLLVFPDKEFWNFVTFAIVGQVLMILVFILQYPARRKATHLHQSSPWIQIVLEDLFVMLIFITTVSYWKGMWGLLLLLVEGYDQRLVMWLVHGVGFLGLLVLRLSTSLQYGGIFIDGEFPDGLGLVTTVTYVTGLFKPSDELKKLNPVRNLSFIATNDVSLPPSPTDSKIDSVVLHL